MLEQSIALVAREYKVRALLCSLSYSPYITEEKPLIDLSNQASCNLPNRTSGRCM